MMVNIVRGEDFPILGINSCDPYFLYFYIFVLKCDIFLYIYNNDNHAIKKIFLGLFQHVAVAMF